MIKLEGRPAFFVDAFIRVYIVFSDAEPYRIASKDIAERYGVDHEALLGLVWHRVRHKKGLLGSTVVVLEKSTGGRPAQERLLNIRQANDILFDLLPASKARQAMADIRKSILFAGQYPEQKIDAVFEEKVRSRLIYYLAKERTRAGISQNQMAARIGVSAALFCQWLKDGYPIPRSIKTDRIINFACEMFPELLVEEKEEGSAGMSDDDVAFSKALEAAFKKMRDNLPPPPPDLGKESD
jgi:transcriptional regulator with XRE-family HTH domain